MSNSATSNPANGSWRISQIDTSYIEPSGVSMSAQKQLDLQRAEINVTAKANLLAGTDLALAQMIPQHEAYTKQRAQQAKELLALEAIRDTAKADVLAADTEPESAAYETPEFLKPKESPAE
jgi:hypothetical protein